MIISICYNIYITLHYHLNSNLKRILNLNKKYNDDVYKIICINNTLNRNY